MPVNTRRHEQRQVPTTEFINPNPDADGKRNHELYSPRSKEINDRHRDSLSKTTGSMALGQTSDGPQGFRPDISNASPQTQDFAAHGGKSKSDVDLKYQGHVHDDMDHYRKKIPSPARNKAKKDGLQLNESPNPNADVFADSDGFGSDTRYDSDAARDEGRFQGYDEHYDKHIRDAPRVRYTSYRPVPPIKVSEGATSSAEKKHSAAMRQWEASPEA